MNIIVLDCSIAVPWFFPEEPEAVSMSLMKAVGASQVGCIAPELLKTEFANVAWKKVRRGLCSTELAMLQFRSFAKLPIEYIGLDSILPKAFDLACNHGLPVYDCLYLAIAKMGSIGLATLDQKLAAIAQKEGVPAWLEHIK